jgi:hypothetical protein
MAMAGTGAYQWTKLLKRNHRPWPHDPEQSIGKFYRKMGRKYCWEAVGQARAEFDEIGTKVKEYLDKNSDPVPETVVFSMYMIGKTKETAKPTLMFCCKDVGCRKTMRSVVAESGILDNYPGVTLGDCSRAPDLDQLVQLAGEPLISRASPNLERGLNSICYDPSKPTFGTQLYIKNSNASASSLQKATAGGIVNLGQRCFYMTAAHPFTKDAQFSPQNSSDCDFDFDIEQSDSEAEETDLVESTSRASLTPEPDQLESTSSHSSAVYLNIPGSPNAAFEGVAGLVDLTTSSKVLTPTSGGGETPGTERITNLPLEALGDVAISSSDGPRPELDYTLIGILASHPHKFNTIGLRSGMKRTFLYPKKVATIENRDIKIITVTGSSGLLEGTLSGTPAFMKHPSSKTFQKVWTVRVDGKLATGDCGSWILDSENGDFLGHIVAGSPATGVAYIVPSVDIFHDLWIRTGEMVWLPIGNDPSEKAETSLRPSHGDAGIRMGSDGIDSERYTYTPSTQAELPSIPQTSRLNSHETSARKGKASSHGKKRQQHTGRESRRDKHSDGTPRTSEYDNEAESDPGQKEELLPNISALTINSPYQTESYAPGSTAHDRSSHQSARKGKRKPLQNEKSQWSDWAWDDGGQRWYRTRLNSRNEYEYQFDYQQPSSSNTVATSQGFDASTESQYTTAPSGHGSGRQETDESSDSLATQSFQYGSPSGTAYPASQQYSSATVTAGLNYTSNNPQPSQTWGGLPAEQSSAYRHSKRHSSARTTAGGFPSSYMQPSQTWGGLPAEQSSVYRPSDYYPSTTTSGFTSSYPQTSQTSQTWGGQTAEQSSDYLDQAQGASQPYSPASTIFTQQSSDYLDQAQGASQPYSPASTTTGGFSSSAPSKIWEEEQEEQSTGYPDEAQDLPHDYSAASQSYPAGHQSQEYSSESAARKAGHRVMRKGKVRR